MKKEIIGTRKISNAKELRDAIIESYYATDERLLAAVDVQNKDGYALSKFQIEEETLSDGSKVFNIILGFEGDENE